MFPPVRPTYARIKSARGTALVNGVTDRHVDNARLCRDVVYHARLASEMIVGMPVWDARKVHAFVKDHLRYSAELDPMDQRLRMPWRSVLDGVLDCKSSCILIAALAKRAGRHVACAFIDQIGHGYDHTFAVVDGVAVDPICNFGESLPYIRRHDEDL